MGKLYVRVREGGIGNRKFLQSDDRYIRASTRPRVVLDELASDCFVFRIVEDPLLVALNVNLETRFNELAGRGGSQSCSTLEWLRLTT